MQALVGNFIVYIVRLKPLMYLYYVRYYKPCILVLRYKDINFLLHGNVYRLNLIFFNQIAIPL